MKTEFSKFEIAAIKRTAQTCSGMIAKFEKLNEKIATLQAEKDKTKQMIDQWDAPIVAMTGYHIMDLVEKEKVKTGVDKDGNDISGSKWVLKYPETVVPCETESNIDVEENTTKIHNIYPISKEEAEPQIVESLDKEIIKFN